MQQMVFRRLLGVFKVFIARFKGGFTLLCSMEILNFVITM